MHRVSLSAGASLTHRRLPSIESFSSPGLGTSEKRPSHSALRIEPDSDWAQKEGAGENTRPAAGPFADKGRDFWLVFLALCVSSFLAAIDLTGVSTVVPTMASEFDSDKYAWVGTAYVLASTALIPWTGGLANIFGRRCVMNAALVLFMAGSAIVGASRGMMVAVAGRSVQGVGGGAILVMSDIIVTDLVPLAHRGPFYGIIGMVWGFASAVGPPIGGILATSGNWRWLFYLNIPVSAVALALVTFFFKLKSPKTSLREKMAQMDWYNVVFVGAASALIVGLSWGGQDYAWTSAATYGPIAGGVVGLGVFLWLEKRFAAFPTVPFEMLTHRNALFGFITTFFHGFVTMTSVYYLPTWFQACKGASAVRSGIDVFSLSFTVAPLAIITGITVTLTGHYLIQNYIGWILTIVGFGLMSLMKADSGIVVWVAYPCVAGTGLGILYTATMFPTLAPLAPSQHPQAMSFYNLARCFGQVFGIALGSTAPTNALEDRLPADFVAAYGASETAIPYIAALAEPARSQVREAYASSLDYVWYVSLGVAALGLISTLGLTSMAMTEETDERWGLEGEGVVGVAAISLAVAGLERVEVEQAGSPADEGLPLEPPRARARAGRHSVRMSVDLLSGIGGRPSVSGGRMTMYESPRPAPGAPARMSVLGMPPRLGAAGAGRGRTSSVDWRMSRV